MTATTIINFPDTETRADGLAVDSSHLPDLYSITNTNGCTWESYADGERYIKVPAHASTPGKLLMIAHNSTEMNSIQNFGWRFDMKYVRIAGPAIGDFNNTVTDVAATVDRCYIQHRVLSSGGIDVMRLNMGLSGTTNLTASVPHGVNIPLGQRFGLGHSGVEAADGGYGVFYNGRCVMAADGDTDGAVTDNIARIEAESKESYEIHIIGPIKIWDTDPLSDAEWLPDTGYGIETNESTWRHIPSGVHGPWGITYGHASCSQIPTKYATGGINPNRVRSVCSGDNNQTITYTLKAAHEIGAGNQYKRRMPFRIPGLMLPATADAVWELDGDSLANPFRVRFRSGAIDIDVGSGIYVTSSVTYAQTSRLDVILIFDAVGKASLIIHDLTQNTEGVQRVKFLEIDFTGLIEDIDTCSMIITMGTSGNPEFEGVVNPPQIQTNFVSSYVATTISSASVDMATGNNFGLGSNFGNGSPDWFQESVITYNSTNPFGRSGLGLSSLADELGNWNDLMPHMRHQKICVLEWQANDAWADMSSYFESLIDTCVSNQVEMLWATQLPVDDNPDDGVKQALVRTNNANLLKYLTTKAGSSVIECSDIAALYTDDEAASTSIDNQHPTAANFAILSVQLMAEIRTVGGARSRDRSRIR